jgi:hypothetical protein
MQVTITEAYSRADSTARGPIAETEQIYVKGGQSDTYSVYWHDLKWRTTRIPEDASTKKGSKHRKHTILTIVFKLSPCCGNDKLSSVYFLSV